MQAKNLRKALEKAGHKIEQAHRGYQVTSGEKVMTWLEIGARADFVKIRYVFDGPDFRCDYHPGVYRDTIKGALEALRA